MKTKKIPVKASEAGDFAAADSQGSTFLLTTIEQIRSVSNPLRMRILHELVAEPMTTKQVALRLGESVTKLYRHVEALAKAGLIRLVREVPKRGTVQKFYQTVAKSFKVADDCLPQGAKPTVREQVIIKLVEQARTGILDTIKSPDHRKLCFAGSAPVHIVDESDLEELMLAISTTIQVWSKKHNKKNNTAKSLRVSFFSHR